MIQKGTAIYKEQADITYFKIGLSHTWSSLANIKQNLHKDVLMRG